MRASSWPWLAVALCAACKDGAAPARVALPAAFTTLATPTSTVTVGTSAGLVSVKVLDGNGVVTPNVLVSFTITRGSGSLGAAAVKTGADGVASTTYRASSIPGQNEITVSSGGLTPVKFSVVGVAGAARAITFTQRSLRYTLAVDSLNANGAARDTFFNLAGTPITWIARDPTLVSVTGLTNAAAVKVLRRPGATYLVATSGGAADSIPVYVLDNTSTPCTYVAAPVIIGLGGSVPFDNGTTCIKSTVAGAEYALVAHLNSASYAVSQSFEVVAEGITTPVAPFPDPAPPTAAANALTAAPAERDFGFEARLRRQEAVEGAPRVASARAAFAAGLKAAPAASYNAIAPVPGKGTPLSLNVNALDFCEKPDLRAGRVAAVSNTAVIVADNNNPAGGFTDDEYASIAGQLDTLVINVDTAAFGAPTDIDGNKRVIIYFTKAVNELTPAGSPSGVVLGFYIFRDLLPRHSAYGECPGSNVGEVFYILVPDPTGTVNSNARDKSYVSRNVIGTIAHEYQHLINASRRMYVNDAMKIDEEVWLNEGLSHIAEELVFYRASGLSPRANITGAQLALGTAARDAFDAYQRSNIARYQQFLKVTESVSPIAQDDGLATRGATWSFLRYVVDRARPSDGDFFRRLVNSKLSGVVNLDDVLGGTGLTTLSALRDWSTSVLVDDNPSTTPANYQQPSWNTISTMAGAGGGLTFTLAPRILIPGLTTAVGIVGGGTAYLRFAVAQNTEASFRVGALGNGPLPAGMRLTIVRIK